MPVIQGYDAKFFIDGVEVGRVTTLLPVLKLLSKAKGAYLYGHKDSQFEIIRDVLVRGGGSGMWYITGIDVEGCRIIDGRRHPEEHYPTLRQARAALETWLLEPIYKDIPF